MSCKFWFGGIAALLATQAVAAKLDAPALEAIRAKNNAPAVGAYLVHDGKTVLLSVAGVRAAGSNVPVTTSDRWHIGSDTKAFTATIICRLVERGLLSYDTTVAQIFKSEAAAFDPAAAKITVADLLRHRAGLPGDPPLDRFPALQSDTRPLPVQRLALVKEYLAKAPQTPPGTTFAYANLGYIILGAIVDRVSGKSWEDELKTEVMAPLGITHYGLGAPGTPGKLDEPRGHQNGKPQEPPEADNPPVYNSAGRLNITLGDWMIFAQDQLKGPTGGGKLLKPATYTLMQTPPAGGDYGFGWGVYSPDGIHKSIQHAGSNTLWYALVSLLPDCHSVLLLVTNDGSANGAHALKDSREAAMDPATGLCPAPGLH
jgi:CubicO group peptidase (beta-lactamase class C family)